MKMCQAVLFAAFLLAVGDRAVHAQNPQPPQPLKAEKIRDDLYVITGDGGNTTVYLTDEGVVLVDTKNDRNHDDLVATVKALSDKPIRYVINTHAHGDHTGGNQKLAGAVSIGHVNARAAMIKGNVPGPPSLTFTDQTYAINGSLLGFPNSADASLKLDWDVVIPGQGPRTNRASFLKWRQDVETIIDRVRSMTRAGRTKTDVEQVLIKEFGWEPTGNPIRSLDAVMAELKQ